MRLSEALRTQLLRHAAEQLPLEACGLLGGSQGSARLFIPCRNAEQSPVRYAIAPEEILQALRQFESEGLELLAVFHSHPIGDAYPSPTDVQFAAYPQVLYLIAAQRGEQLRAFRIVQGQITEEPLED